MGPMPLFSVIIPWADRQELEPALLWNRTAFIRHGVEVVIVNAGGDVSDLAALLQRTRVSNVRGVSLPGATFNRSLCLNVGALLSRGDFLFFLDADIVLTSDIFSEASGPLESSSRFVAVGRILESKPRKRFVSASQPAGPDWSFLADHIHTIEMITKDGRRAVLRRRTSPGLTHAGDGLVLVRKDDVVRVGGLNSGLLGWGYEDTDFQRRCPVRC